MSTNRTWLYGHTEEDSAFYVDDYPYGFRARTEIRYWIESTKNGDRMCSQTRNPNTGKWNKPKKSTYSDVAFLYADENGHVHHAGVSVHANAEWLAEFVAANEHAMTEAQLEAVARIRGIAKAFEKVTFSIRETSSLSAEENAELDRQQNEVWGRVSALASLETDVARRELALPAAPLRRVL